MATLNSKVNFEKPILELLDCMALGLKTFPSYLIVLATDLMILQLK